MVADTMSRRRRIGVWMILSLASWAAVVTSVKVALLLFR
jgi:hypothetical protein